MTDDFQINVHPPYRGHSTGGSTGMGEGRYTTGAFVKLVEEERIPPDDEQRTKFIDELLANYRISQQGEGGTGRIDTGNVREIPAGPTMVKKEAAA